MTPAPQRFAHHELVADAFPLVLIVEPSPHARARRLERPHFAKQLLTCFVEADHRIRWVVGQKVGLDHVLHAPDELGISLWRHAPRLDDPRLDVVFF
jgi:hypothetical protein